MASKNKSGRPINRYDNDSKEKNQGGEEPPQKRSSVKNQIRSIKRLLAKTNFKGPAAEKHLKRLEQLESLLTKNSKQKARTERETKLSKKYHKVKFFERVKIERKIRRLEKSIKEGASASAVAELQSEKEKLEEDLVYVKFFPKGEKYISLFGKDDLTPDQRLKREKLRGLAIAAAKAQHKDLAKSTKEKPPKSPETIAKTSTDDADDFFL